MREPQTIKTTPREVLWELAYPLWKVISSKVSIQGKACRGGQHNACKEKHKETDCTLRGGLNNE